MSIGGRSLSAFDLSGRRALVTGSTRGIGAGIALALASAGASVVINGRNGAAVHAAAKELTTRAHELGAVLPVETAVFDVTDHETMRAVVDEVELGPGGIDILVNCAGIQHGAPLSDFALGDWDRVLATNLTSCFVLSQQVAQGMIRRGRGKIINICSVQNRVVSARTAAYAAAKAGLGSLTQVMCASWAEHGVQANGLAPGFIRTDLTSAMTEDPVRHERIRSRIPAGRWGSPDDLGGTAVWLASGASDYVNGQIIFVDGGMTAVI